MAGSIGSIRSLLKRLHKNGNLVRVYASGGTNSGYHGVVTKVTVETVKLHDMSCTPTANHVIPIDKIVDVDY
ncbi:MAG: hypothetical protein M0Z55_12610 [Peptococcaceae bacterium]|nr:hypothetical protein [Peptococcaceae bacterium]